MLNALQLLELQLELEGKAFNQDGYLIQFLEVPDEDPLQVCAVDFGDTRRTIFGAGIPGDIEQALRSLPFEAFFDGPEAVVTILERHQPCRDHGRYITYQFPDGSFANEDPKVQLLDPSDPRLESVGGGFYKGSASPIFSFVYDNRVLCAGVSVRESDRAGELWVLTLPGARGRGFARRVAIAWQQYLKTLGKIPIYSHKYENILSQHLAKSLGLVKAYEQAGFS